MTILDAFEPAITASRPVSTSPAPAAAVVAPEVKVKPARPNPLVRARDAVAADVREAWLWQAHGLSARQVWEQRIPDLDQVPAGSKVLQAGWTVFNHAVLPILLPALVLLWTLGHPARFLALAAVAAPITAIWLI